MPTTSSPPLAGGARKVSSSDVLSSCLVVSGFPTFFPTILSAFALRGGFHRRRPRKRKHTVTMASGTTTTTLTKKLGVRIFRSLVPYGQAQSLQTAIHCARKNAFVPDTLLILQHPSVVTVGKRAEVGLKSIKTDEATLKELKCDVFKSDRGGDVTYHGPGQIVVYPIVHLRERKLGARKYVEKLENVMIEVAKKHGITNAKGQMKNENDGSDMSGVWVGKKKLGAVGVKISGGVTSHGFALNSETDLEFFREHIMPCGLEGMDVTSLKELVGGEVKRERLEVEIVDAFAKEYGYTEVYTRRC